MKYWNEYIKNIEAYKPGDQPKVEGTIIKLNTNESPFPPSPKVESLLKNLDISELRLYPNPTAQKLCSVVATKFGVSHDNVMATNGSDEALTYIFNAFISNKKLVMLTNPTYTVYEALAQRFDVTFSVIETENDFSVDLSKVPNEEHTVFFLANPNAQTGLYIDYDILESFVKNFKGLIIVDEAYIDFAPKSALPLILKYDNVIVTRTMSKSYSLCGIRLGFALSSVSNIEALYKVKDSYNINMLTQLIGEVAIDEQDYMLTNAKTIISERVRVTSELTKMGFSVVPSNANFILAKPPKNNAKDIFEALKTQNIFVRYFDTDRLKEYLRITIGSENENSTLLEAIKEILVS